MNRSPRRRRLTRGGLVAGAVGVFLAVALPANAATACVVSHPYVFGHQITVRDCHPVSNYPGFVF